MKNRNAQIVSLFYRRSFMALALGIVFFLFACNEVLRADDIEVSAPRTVEVGQPFQISFSVSARPKKIEPPLIDGATILAGPSTSSSQNVQIDNNGQVYENATFTLSYFIKADKEGKIKVGSASVNVNGKVIQSKPFTINAVKGSRQASQNQQQGQRGTSSSDSKVDGSDLFVRVLLNKNSAYVGEQITASIKLYTRLEIIGDEGVKLPTFNGFYRQDVESKPVSQFDRETVNGKVYGTAVIKKFVLWPQKTGDLVVDPVELQLVVQKVIRSHRARSLLEEFLGSGPSVENIRQVIKSTPVKVKVKSLPEPQPASYYGAVGNFTLKTSVDKTKAKANDAITFKVTLSGSGSLNLSEAPKITFPADFEVYDPKVNENINNSASGSSGSKTWEYVIIPRNAGKFEIPAVEYSTFKPVTGKYSTLTSQAISLNIDKGDGVTNGVVIQRNDIKVIGNDIRYIKLGRGRLKPAEAAVFGAWYFWLIIALCVISVVVVWRFWKNKVILASNVSLLKQKRASRMAERRLKEAASLLHSSNRIGFFEAIHSAIWGYLGDKLSISPAKLSREAAFEMLQSRSIDHELLEKLSLLLDACEMERFAPISTFSSLDEVYVSAREAITQIDAKLKSKKS
jgi:hypothetical protein